MHIHPCTNLGHEHTQIHTYSEFQFHSNLSVSCSVQVRVYICICNSVYKCMQRGDSNTAEIHRIHTCAATKRVEGRAWHLLCTQALPRLTFHCHTVEMGDKVTHTHSHTHTHTLMVTHTHTVGHTLTCTIDKVWVHSHLKKCASGRGTQVPTSTHHTHAHSHTSKAPSPAMNMNSIMNINNLAVNIRLT